ncbi:ABC transporter ATP-binding protein [Engelhardtia mirabilis]|uniref:Daunorubicin/doxorubicin resistance ATP-binding protein DrrA n=1 Tax=Engelhardtia mirabilis TaxID=2528011 RepID=A0A518BNU2_9BACT|nr:Daunorubicin/doxorubicin resistance ATP-binding protein DrrA [Planctomycetes bacterium Pla133]QDV02977.1 Daunorubicin/doxorubicin resistance ATP-binding protein DrrA [Planctomycetes bacterium Pla86]
MSTESAPLPGPQAVAILARGLKRSYRSGFLLARRAVLRGVDLDLAAGAVGGLIGPNGSGKSTLLRLLAGVDPADGGELSVLGGDPRTAAVRTRIGYATEGCPFPDELPARVVLELLLRMRGLHGGEARSRALRLLDRAGLGADAKRSLGQFSSGMRRRFVLAQAFATDPHLVLLDEPSVGLDAEGAEVLEQWLDEAHARGAAALICSHRPDDLFGRCERVSVMIEGRVVLNESARALAERATRVELEIEGAGSQDLDAARRELEARGAVVRATRPAAAALDALYRSLGSTGRGAPAGVERDG